MEPPLSEEATSVSAPVNEQGDDLGDSLGEGQERGQEKGRFSTTSLVSGFAAAALAVVLLLAVFSGTGDEVSVEVEDFATLAFLTADGETSTLADYRGDPLVVNFFASWCAPCRAELPDFEAVHLANIDTVRFIGVNHDLDEVTWRNFVAETDITFETVFQPNTEIWTEMDAKGTPATAFISADGELLQLWTGVLNEQKLQELIDTHLKVKA